MKAVSIFLATVVFSMSYGKTLESKEALENYMWSKLPIEYRETDPSNTKNYVIGLGDLYVSFEKGIIEVIGLRESAKDKERYNFFYYKAKIMASKKIDSLRYSFEGVFENIGQKMSGFVEFEVLNSEMSYYQIRNLQVNISDATTIKNKISEKGKTMQSKFADVNFEDKESLNSNGEIVKSVPNMLNE